MTEVILTFEDMTGTVLWSETVPGHVGFTAGDVIHLATTVQPGCEALWEATLPMRGDFRVIQVRESFEKRYGVSVASVRSFHSITVIVHAL